MQNAIYIALSSQMALQRRMDVVANNMANLSTPAYKGEQMLFSQYLVQPPGTTPLAFVQDNSTVRDLRQGPISTTGNPLDLALQGSGFFAVETPLGTRYTRNGHFTLDAQGQLVTSEGHPILDDTGQPITIPTDATAITIAPDGTISVKQPGSTADVQVGKIQVVDFAAPEAVTPGANGLYVTDQTPEPAQGTTMQQGMIEESNVQAVVELTRMMAVSRASSRIKDFLDEEDQRQRDAIDKLSKVS